MNAQALIDKLFNDGVLEDDEHVALQVLLDDKLRFEELLKTMHSLMAASSNEISDDDFTLKVEEALEKADPTFYK